MTFILMGYTVVLIIKWVFHGRTKAGNEDLWGYQAQIHFIMWPAVAKLLGPMLAFISGTLLENYIWRSLGAHIGKRSLILEARYTDMDMVFIGDDCVIQNKMW